MPTTPSDPATKRALKLLRRAENLTADEGVVAWFVRHPDTLAKLLAQAPSADAKDTSPRTGPKWAPALVHDLRQLCDDQWLRRRDRAAHLDGAAPRRLSAASELEQVACEVRLLLDAVPVAEDGTDPYLKWLRGGRDRPAERG